MKVNVEKQPKSMLKIEITVPANEVKKTYEQIIDQLVKAAELPGFRKGKAPKDKVMENTDISKVHGEVVNVLLQEYYPLALKEHHISPISSPKIEITEFQLDKDFTFNAFVALKPNVVVKSYKAKMKNRFEKKLEVGKKELKKINEEKLKKGEKIEEPHIHLTVEEVLDELIKLSEVDVADILVDEETDRMISRLIDQAQTIGMSLEQYLNAQNKTGEDLRKEYAVVAERNLKAEFILMKLIEDEKIEVEEKEVEAAIEASGDEETMAKLREPTQKWYIKTVLAKNKLLQNIIEEAEGEHHHDHE